MKLFTNTLISGLALVSATLLTTKTVTAAPKPKNKKAKNVILMIGDGMGPQQLGLLFTYAKMAPNSVYLDKKIGIEEVMQQGRTGLWKMRLPKRCSPKISK